MSYYLRTSVVLLVVFGFSTAASAGILVGPISNPSNGHNYYLLDATLWTPSGFAASEAEAVSLGGHLVTINDAAEDQWVFSTFAPFLATTPGILGIGLNDLVTEGDYVWTSGAAVSYLNWDPYPHPPIGPQPDGDPDDVVGIAVGFFTPGRWHDFNTIDDDVPPASVYAVVEVTSVPEPSTLVHSVCGAIALALACRRRAICKCRGKWRW